MSDLQIPKERWQSKQVYSWTNKQPCICGRKRCGSTQSHHSTSRGWVAGSDDKLIPLGVHCHQEFHHSGLRTEEWLRKRGVNLNKELARLHTEFLNQNNIVWDQTRWPSFIEVCDAHGLSTRYQESKRVNRVYKWEDSPKRFRPINERTDLGNE